MKLNKEKLETFFTTRLLKWNREQNNRLMPWKGEKDPYKIWLSEIILQQTRVEQGLEYYNRFIQQYPRIELLASAPEEEIFKLWEGLGYYTRCKNLIATARFIALQLDGKFPADHERQRVQLHRHCPARAADDARWRIVADAELLWRRKGHPAL